MIKTFVVWLFVSLAGLICYAQKPLTNSRQSSYYTYIYKLNPEDVLKFYKFPDKEIDERILHNPVDSFKTDKNWINNLPAGNYLKVFAEKNKLQYRLLENRSALLQILRNNYDLRFILTDKVGNKIENAKIFIKNRAVPFDATTNSYHTHFSNKTLVRVDYAGIANFYQLQANNNYSKPFFSANWFKYKWYSIKKLFKKSSGDDDYYKYRNRLDINEHYTGFIVFNKPIYKPLDTVKLKAFIVDRKSKQPIKASHLLVRIQNGYDDNGKIIGHVDSYRDGGFEFSFVLTDSLKLDLDDNYYLSLEDASSVKYDLDKHDGGDNDEKYLSQRKVYIAGKFRYEDYELKSTTFTMRADKKEHEPGNPLAIYLRAIDENDLPVQDGRVMLNLVTTGVERLKANSVFVPDTLWKYKVQLEPVGETKVMVPDSIFPKADVNYTINADFLNSDNEHKESREYIDFKYNNYKINADLSFDTLKIVGLMKGKVTNLPARIYLLNNVGDTVSKSKVSLPAAIVINPNIKSYIVDADSVALTANIANFKSDLNFAGYQTADSLFVKINNPHRVHFWYWVISNNNLIDQGEANDLFYKKKYTDKGAVIFVLSYIWAGETKITGLAIPYQDKLLTINIKQPLSVYPGQQVTTEIEVKDALGKPVANTDITAWSITRKFPDYAAPFVPYLGKSYPGLRLKPFQNIHSSDHSDFLQLNWSRWRREIGLDSIEYYKFTHPATIYKMEEPAPDSVTQVAPFVIHNGDVKQTHILFIDERPVYFDQAKQLQRYSFMVPPGKHNLRLRTSNQNITLDSVYVQKGKKLILSINDDTLVNKEAHFQKLPDTLLRYEADALNKYLVSVVENFGLNMATLEQDDHIYLLNPNPQSAYYNKNNQLLVGPLANNSASFSHKGEQSVSFLPEPGYSYLFEPGLIKQKSIDTKYPFSNFLFDVGTDDYTQYALTRTETENMWKHYLDLRSHTTALFKNETITDKTKGKLSIVVNSKEGQLPFIKNIIIYRDGYPDFIRIHPGNITDLGGLAPGNYRLFFLLEKDNYYIKNNISIKPYGTNFYRVNVATLREDAVSEKIDSIITNRVGRYQASDNNLENDALKLKEAFNDKYINKESFKNEMFGRVISSDDKSPLAGVSIRVKGTSLGVSTDINGNFSIKVPSSGNLLVNYIGFEPKQVEIAPGKNVEIILTLSKNSLNEVEVVAIGYGSQRRQDLTGSVSTIQANSPGSATVFNIRGIGTLSEKKPLIVVDGVVVENMNAIDPSTIGEITTLKDASATAIYGSRAANGVIIISTKKRSAVTATDTSRAENESSIRKNFSDYAYWQPKLTTDINGKASFTTIFPDDITNWRTFVIGINARQQTGFADNQIKSFKPLSANLVAPLFAVSGDEFSSIGKVLNYGVNPIKLTRTVSYNGNLLKQDAFEVKNSKIDTVNITATHADSLTFEYSIKRDNGYFDGERRKIPVIEQGVKETRGIFQILNADTAISMKFDPALGPVTLNAEASVLPALVEEADHLRQYKYLCNEQLASKLKGLLAEKRIKTYLGQPFKWDKNVLEVIKKLQENRRSQGTWGWWKDTDEELWISLHAVEALTDAKKDGYAIDIDEKKLTDYLVYQLESYKGEEKLACLQLLHKLSARVDYQKYFGVITKEFAREKQVSRYDRFRLMLLQQEAGVTVKMDSILDNEHHTLFGNAYWGEDSYRFFDNSIQLGVLAYKIIKNEGKHPELLEKIRGYFLEQRSTGEWRNTYESSLILETILPDLLTDGKKVKPSVLVIKGAKTDTISKFPYTATLTDNQLSASKTGSLPVYISGYQQFWNRHPEKVNKEFAVDTWFEKKDVRLDKLKGGEPVLLKAEVTVKGDADFVMIEIPIPAGCAYESKAQSWENNEVHREYFKEKVSIFCRKLKQGKYEFTVNLIPRYNGKYNLNPAKAEMMYFPVFYGREGMKRVVIGE